MKLLSLHIDGFGKFKNKDLQFADNMNIVYGYKIGRASCRERV